MKILASITQDISEARATSTTKDLESIKEQKRPSSPRSRSRPNAPMNRSNTNGKQSALISKMAKAPFKLPLNESGNLET
jgi:hypothetical protein